MKITRVLQFPVIFIALTHAAGQGITDKVEAFKSLSGKAQVEKFFHDGFGPYFLFRQLGRLPGEMRSEQDILTTSSDPEINEALAIQARGDDHVKASYAIYLICRRARYIPGSEFPFKVANGNYVTYVNSRWVGSLTPFDPDFARVGGNAAAAVKEALNSPDSKLKNTALLYSGQLAHELDSLTIESIVQQWSDQFDRLPSPRDAFLAYSTDEGERFRCIERALAARGLEAAVLVSVRLSTETNPEKRLYEIELLLRVDQSSVRLRASTRGRDVIKIVRETIAGQKLPHYKSADERASFWQEVAGNFNDRFAYNCRLGFGSALAAMALEHYHGKDPSEVWREGGTICDPSLMREFVSYLTDFDPVWPSWVYPEAGGDDQLHPRFAEKVSRYDQVWKEFLSKRRGSAAN